MMADSQPKMPNAKKSFLLKISVFCGLLAWHFPLHGAETRPPASPPSATATPIVWPATGRKKQLGQGDARFFKAEVPVEVITDAAKVLRGSPSNWYVANHENRFPGGLGIVNLKDKNNQIIYLTGPQQ